MCLQFGRVPSELPPDLSGRCTMGSGLSASFAYCDNKNFTETPKFYEPKRFEMLTLSENKISIVKANEFKNLYFLGTLHLEQNLINTIKDGAFEGLSNLTYLNLQNNRLTSLRPGMFRGLHSLGWLYLSKNNISAIEAGTFKDLPKLTGMFLGDNQLTSLQASFFDGVSSLKILFLNSNKLTVLDAGVFRKLSSLENLNIDSNNLTSVPAGVFSGLSALNKLSLEENNISSLFRGSFRGLSSLEFLFLKSNHLSALPAGVFGDIIHLKILYSDDWRVCCIANASSIPCLNGDPDSWLKIGFNVSIEKEFNRLRASTPFSSCEDLMHDVSLRIFIWILGIFSIGFNSGVIVWRLISRCRNTRRRFSEQKQKEVLLSICLAFGDFCMGIFLFIIATADDRFRGYYILQDDQWRNSSWCSLAGFLSAFSSELSVFVLTLITLDRYFAIVHGTTGRVLSYFWVTTIAVCLFMLAALLAAVPLMNSTFSGFYNQTGTCLALPLTYSNSNASNSSAFDEKQPTWIYSFSVFIGLNSISVVIIIFCYARIFWKAVQSNRRTRNTVRNLQSRMGSRIMLIVATDMACWVPIILMGFRSLLGYQLPPTAYAWVAVFVLPINSAINPVIYSFYTEAFRKAVGKKFRVLFRLLRRYPKTDHPLSPPEDQAGQPEMMEMETFSSL